MVTETDVDIRPFDCLGASEAEYEAYFRLASRLHEEGWPGDPPLTRDEIVRGLRIMPSHVRRHTWVAWRPDSLEMVARGSLYVRHAETNQHAASFDIGVAPEMRRGGLATRLLREILQAATAADRRLLTVGTKETVPAGAAFVERIGARFGQTDRVSQLDLGAVDPDLLRRWQAEAPLQDGFTLEAWDGPWPEEALPMVAAMYQAINGAPRGDLEMEDDVWTPERIREGDRCMVERKAERWCMYVRAADGEVAGYTDVYWESEHPEIVHQGDTAVFPRYRQRGIGRWLKAAMLEKVLRERPQASRIRTWNAQSNAPMLGINVALGFKPYRAHTEWQVDLAQVREYLTTRAG